MNNPFASNRNIFNNIIKPVRVERVEGDRQAEGNSSSNNGSSNIIGHTKTYSNVNGNTSGNNLGGGSNVNMNSVSNLGGGKVDLNFRNQFRTSAVSNTNNPNTTSINDNNQPKLISDKQYPAYQPQSSGVPSLSIPNQSNTNTNTNTNIAATKYNVSNMNINTTNNMNPNINTNSYQSIGSSKFGMQSQQGVVSGVQRQKFTFGVGSVSGDNSHNKLEYDRSKFINREEFTAMPSSNSSNYNMGNMGVIRQSSTNPTNTPNNNNMMMNTQPKQHISMSPIQEHSRHKIDDNDQHFLDIDAMGDDIQKILASSKNQEELYRLLGIDNTGDKSERFNTNTNHNMYQTNTNTNIANNMYGINSSPNMYNLGTSNVSNPIQNTNNNTNNNMYKNYNNRPNTASISPPPTQNILTNTTPAQNPIHNYNYNSQENEENHDRDEQVFNYQIQNVYNRNTTKNVYNNKLTNGQSISIGASTSNYITQSNNNIGLASTNSYTAPNKPTNTNSYISELQESIDSEMKKLATNGKYRTFLSATDKIQTVKYQLEYI